MQSKILKFARDLNKPLINFIVRNGWFYRLKKKKLNNGKFRKLTREERRSIKNYWKQYDLRVSSDWCAYLSWGNGIVDEKYIPESLFYGEIVGKLGDEKIGYGLSDKNIYDWLFNTKQPETIARKVNSVILDKDYKPIDFSEVYEKCASKEGVIIKPTNDTYGGSGIYFWKRNDDKSCLYDILKTNENLIIQEIAKQHPFFESIHPASLNTLRIVTLLIEGQPVHLSTILRMGKDNSQIDNYSAGGLICPVDNDGYLFEEAVQSDQTIINKHPNGFVFNNKKIPYYERIIEDAKRMHYRIPHFKLVSWDYSLTPDGYPLLIEGNYPAGQIDLHQLNIGPIFGKYTDKVLKHVYNGGEL